jgi:hypothetical protein
MRHRLLGGSPWINSTISWRAKFPGRREKCREFRRFSRFLRKSVAKTPVDTIACEIIPYTGEQGIILREQGISSAFWAGAGIWLEIEPRTVLDDKIYTKRVDEGDAPTVPFTTNAFRHCKRREAIRLSAR